MCILKKPAIRPFFAGLFMLICSCSSAEQSTDQSTKQSADQSTKQDTQQSATQGTEQSFIDTKTGQPMKIDSGLFNTEESKKFLSTGENPYNGNAEAIATGKKHYQAYSCAQCHGAQAQGQTAGGITGPRYNHSKTATDKGMFEIIWAGTNNGMSGKGKGVMDPSNRDNGLSPDEVLRMMAWIRSQPAGK